MDQKKKTDHAILEAVTVLSVQLGKLETETNAQHEEKMKKMADIEAQVKYTNGRVTKLEQDALRREAVEEYIARQGPATAVRVETNTTWDWKTVLAILLTLATAVVAIAGVAK